jgi:hypothetical protein
MGRVSQGQAKLAGQTGFRSGSLLAEGRKHAATLAAALASTARAFPTLEGLCGPEAGYGAGLSSDFAESDRQTVPVLV